LYFQELVFQEFVFQEFVFQEFVLQEFVMATLADAIELAGRSVIYAGKELSPEVWTCPLLAA